MRPRFHSFLEHQQVHEALIVPFKHPVNRQRIVFKVNPYKGFIFLNNNRDCIITHGFAQLEIITKQEVARLFGSEELLAI